MDIHGRREGTEHQQEGANQPASNVRSPTSGGHYLQGGNEKCWWRQARSLSVGIFPSRTSMSWPRGQSSMVIVAAFSTSNRQRAAPADDMTPSFVHVNPGWSGKPT